MLKKLIALTVICAMLAPLSSAVAADNTPVTPTIEFERVSRKSL